MRTNWLARMGGLGLLAVAGYLGWAGLGQVNAQGPGMGMPKGGMGGMGMGGMGMHKGGMGMGQGMSKGGMGMGGMGGCGMGMHKGGMGMSGMGMHPGGMGMGGMGNPVMGMHPSGMGMSGMRPQPPGMGSGQIGMPQPIGTSGLATLRSGSNLSTSNSQNGARSKKDILNDNQVQRALQERAKAIQAQKDRKLADNEAINK